MENKESKLEQRIMNRRTALRLGVLGSIALTFSPSEVGATPGPCRPRKGYALFEDIKENADPNARIGKLAPPFHQKNINPNSPTYGTFIGPQNYSGKVVALNLWASYCQPCLEELAEFQKIFQTRDDLSILGLVAGENGVDPEVDELSVLTKVTYPILGNEGRSSLNVRACENQGEINAAYFDHQKGKRAGWMGLMVAEQLYGFKQLPTTFIIDKQQMVREVQVRALDVKGWEDKLHPYLS